MEKIKNEKGMTKVEMNVKEFEVKAISKKLGLAVARFSKDQPWALMIGKNLVSKEEFKSVFEAKLHMWRNWAKYKEIRLMIIIETMIEEHNKRNLKLKKNKN